MADDKRFKPDPASLLRARSKKVLDEQLEEALDNPALDAAIAKVAPKLKPGEDPLYYDISRRVSSPSLTPVTPIASAKTEHDDAEVDVDATVPRGAAPAEPKEGEIPVAASPWAQALSEEIDRAVLPSAHLPAPAPPTSVPIAPEPPTDASTPPRRGFPAWAKGVIAVLGVAAPTTIALIVGRHLPADGPRPPASIATVAAAATPPAPTIAPSTATAVPTAAFSASPDTTDGGVAPAPSTSATTAPAAPSAPARPRSPGKSDRDPPSSPPSAPATVAPTAPPATASSTPAPPASGKGPPEIF